MPHPQHVSVDLESRWAGALAPKSVGMCKTEGDEQALLVCAAQAASTPTPPQVDQDLCGGRGRLGYLLIQCIAYQMHCLSNVLVIQWLLSTADAHTPSRSRSRYIGIWHICLQHGRRTHRRLTRRAGRATPLRHSSPALLSGCVRVCGREGGRVLGHAMHWPWNAAAIQRIGHTGAPAPLARLRTHTPPPHRPQAEALLSGCGGERVGGWAICC